MVRVGHPDRGQVTAPVGAFKVQRCLGSWQDLPSRPPVGFKSLTFLPLLSLKEKKGKTKRENSLAYLFSQMTLSQI